MSKSRWIALVAVLGACEPRDALPEPAPVFAPEPPALDTMRSSTRVADPPPPAAAPVRPDMINIPSRMRRWFAGLDPEARASVRTLCREQRRDPCFGLIQPASSRPFADVFATHGVDVFDASAFCTHQNRGGRTCDTPLVVAFDAQPIVFGPASAARFAFRPGDPVATAWPTAASPWIALDRDGDGSITSGAELFGDSTARPDGALARHGFDALAILDDNRDGVIDREDPAFASLLLWADTNADRKSSPDELRSLAEVVISIPLAHHVEARCHGGHCEGERGAVYWRDPSGSVRTGAVVDVYLQSP